MLSRGRVPDVAAMQARGEKGSSDPTDPRLPHPFPHPQSRKASVSCELKLQGVLRGACIRELSSQNPFVLPAILLTAPNSRAAAPCANLSEHLRGRGDACSCFGGASSSIAPCHAAAAAESGYETPTEPPPGLSAALRCPAAPASDNIIGAGCLANANARGQRAGRAHRARPERRGGVGVYLGGARPRRRG